MKVAILQQALLDSAAEEIDALVESIADACAAGARVVVCPHLPTLLGEADAARERIKAGIGACPEGTALLTAFREPRSGGEVGLKQTPLGRTALLVGDECIDPQMTDALGDAGPEAIVMRPLAESDLQAEAILERAIALSASITGLVIIADPVGAEPGTAGHGGSAVLYLGDVLAEAGSEAELLLVDIEVPVGAPEPRESVPDLPPILVQRLAYHQGRKPDVGYLADLS